ncbi:Bardet-Biedl syndrome 10 protein [Brachionichthys hirsutus]|uniref:Bardet-Biedl syndrome 10 protein n=1 Tax=Brachionichthys hirsutus TaxID=412623 RepID=UPI0036052343
MLPGDHLRLKDVLQTVSVLESVVRRCFGPEGGQVLFTRDTGQAMLSRSGTRILTALRLEHPVARMAVECVLRHSTLTGDGSKTFVLLLASLLRIIHSKACMEPDASQSDAATASRLARELLAFGTEELGDVISVGVVPYGDCLSLEEPSQLAAHRNNLCVPKLLASFYRSRLGHAHCGFMSDLTYDLLTRWNCKNGQPTLSFRFVNDNFPALHSTVAGFPISCSRLIEGQVIHRDFAASCPPADHQPAKAVVFTGHLQPKLLRAGEVLELGGGTQEKEKTSIVQLQTWSERCLDCVVANLQRLGVSVLLSAVKQSAAVLALAAQAGMFIVECVSEDELFLFAQLSGARPVSDCWALEAGDVATLAFCRPIVLGAHRYVHVGFRDSEERASIKPCSLVICGLGEGQTDQSAGAFQDAVRMLLAAWEPIDSPVITSVRRASLHTDRPTHEAPVLESGRVIPAGGTFEFLLNHALLRRGRHCSAPAHANMGNPAVSQLLANAVLSVPRQVYSQRPQRFLWAQTGLVTFIQNRSHPVSLVHKGDDGTILVQGQGDGEGPLREGKRGTRCYRETRVSSKDFMLNSGLESVSCKYQLLLAVLQCASCLLQVDAVLHTHTPLHTQSRRPAAISWEASEDEVED